MYIGQICGTSPVIADGGLWVKNHTSTQFYFLQSLSLRVTSLMLRLGQVTGTIAPDPCGCRVGFFKFIFWWFCNILYTSKENIRIFGTGVNFYNSVTITDSSGKYTHLLHTYYFVRVQLQQNIIISKHWELVVLFCPVHKINRITPVSPGTKPKTNPKKPHQYDYIPPRYLLSL